MRVLPTIWGRDLTISLRMGLKNKAEVWNLYWSIGHNIYGLHRYYSRNSYFRVMLIIDILYLFICKFINHTSINYFYAYYPSVRLSVTRSWSQRWADVCVIYRMQNKRFIGLKFNTCTYLERFLTPLKMECYLQLLFNSKDSEPEKDSIDLFLAPTAGSEP